MAIHNAAIAAIPIETEEITIRAIGSLYDSDAIFQVLSLDLQKGRE